MIVLIFIYIFALSLSVLFMRIHFELNSDLYIKNPEDSDLGRKIISQSIEMIHRHGFEAFTFKKLANQISTTEAGIYRYFENKHRLLLYLISWYWNWLHLQIRLTTNNLTDPFVRLKKVIDLLSAKVQDDKTTTHVNETTLHQVVIAEGSKAYLTHHVDEDNELQFFKPYKDLVALLADMIQACNKKYNYPRSLATTIIEMAHYQRFFSEHLPSLTDTKKTKKDKQVQLFLYDLVSASLKAGKK